MHGVEIIHVESNSVISITIIVNIAEVLEVLISFKYPLEKLFVACNSNTFVEDVQSRCFYASVSGTRCSRGTLELDVRQTQQSAS